MSYRAFLLQTVEHSGFGGNDDLLWRGWPCNNTIFLGRANFVCKHADRTGAFRVGDYGRIGNSCRILMMLACVNSTCA